jgi:tetratricopeptide (TPR) repeat protein
MMITRNLMLLSLPLAAAPLLSGCGNLTCSQARIDSINHMNAGVEAASDKHYEVAVQELQTATNLDPTNEQAFWNLSQVYFQQQKWQDEADALQKALKLDDDDWAYHWNLGDAEMKLTNWDQAEAELTRALQINPNLFEAEHHLGQVEMHLDKPQSAAQHLTKACQLNARKPGSFIDLTQLYLRWDYVDQALMVMQAAEANNEDPDVHLVYGQAYDAKGDYQNAIDEFNKCLADAPDNYQAMFQLGMDYANIGDKQHAIDSLHAFQKQAAGKADAIDTLDAANSELYNLSGD